MSTRISNDKSLIWSGEHWIAYLRRSGEERDSGSVSLYHTRYGPTGEGNVAFVDIPGEKGLTAVCTDNRKVASFIIEAMIRGRSNNPFDRDLPILDAEISRGGDIHSSPSWIIRTERGSVITTWFDIQPPLILEGPGPIHDGRAVTYSLLFFTDAASITLDGANVAGSPYVRDIWRKAIGRPGSSCVFALAETITTVPDG